MPLAVPCPTCRHPLNVRDDEFDQLLTCPTCSNPLVVMRPARVPPHLDPTAPAEPDLGTWAFAAVAAVLLALLAFGLAARGG